VNRAWNWDTAGRACRSVHKDAHLVVINNAEEDREIAKMMNSTDSQGPFYISYLIVKVVSN